MRMRLLALGMMLVATGAAAQSGPPHLEMMHRQMQGLTTNMPPPPVEAETHNLRELIDQGRKEGTLSKDEARALRRQVDDIDAQAITSGGDDTSGAQRSGVDSQVRVLRDTTNNLRLKNGPPKPRD